MCENQSSKENPFRLRQVLGVKLGCSERYWRRLSQKKGTIKIESDDTSISSNLLEHFTERMRGGGNIKFSFSEMPDAPFLIYFLKHQ